MKSLLLFFVLFSLFNSVHAQNLCDASCEFSATFPQGGSLEAIDELTLTFGAEGELILGTGGTVNTSIQPSSLDFTSGGTLFLSAGESITFGPGGSLILGTGGNMDALSYNLSTTGDITIGATGGNQSININGDLGASGVLSFTSNSLEINSTITAVSQLNLENSTTISGSGSITTFEYANVSIGNVVSVWPIPLSLSDNSGVIIYGSDLFNPDIQPLQHFDPVFNDLEFPISDGSNCIVTSPECIADDGTIYVLSSEGKLVKKETPSDNSTSGKSGAFGLPFLGFFMILLFLSGSRKTLKS